MAIEGVIFEFRGEGHSSFHSDHRRNISTMFNGDFNDFRAAQVKFARLKQDCVMGNHWHDYREMFHILDGEGEFVLVDIDSEKRESYILQPGYSLFIPARVAHRFTAKAGTLLVGADEQPYVSAAANDIPYRID